MKELFLGALLFALTPELVFSTGTTTANPAATCDKIWKQIADYSYLKYVCSNNMLRSAVLSKEVSLSTDYGKDKSHYWWFLPREEVMVYVLNCPSKPELKQKPLYFKPSQQVVLEPGSESEQYKNVKEIKCEGSGGLMGYLSYIGLFFVGLGMGILGYAFSIFT